MFSIGINSNASKNASNIKPQLLFSIPKIDIDKINQQAIYCFPNGFKLSKTDILPKIYSTVINEEKDIKLYINILLFYEKITDFSDNKDNNTETIYCPIAIIISSHYAKVDFFKELLTIFYKIIKYDTSILYNINDEENNNRDNYLSKNKEEKILLFQKLEFLNYINFCLTILRPPNKSILELETRFDKIQCKFQSLKEIPTSDYCIEVLFDTLEITVIIKLFIALLFEKQIIIISNQNMLLFCICESILKLIFPFRWLYTYIPNLPKERIDILDIKRPYLIGIISNENDAVDLNNKFPSNIICDVNTSTLYGNTSNLKLPFNEEMKIKTKLLLLKDKYRNNYDEFDIDDNIFSTKYSTKRDSTDKYEDVDFNLSFAENVHNIFFKIFKNTLMEIKKEYKETHVFDSQKFLDLFDDEEYKLFFEKIIITSAFDYFISSMKFLDNSLSMQFNLVYNFANRRLFESDKKITYFNYSLIIPKKLNLTEDNNKNLNNQLIEIKDNDVSFLFDNYNKVSSIIEENLEMQKRNSIIKYNMYPIIKEKSEKKMKFSFIHFYGNNSFIQFMQNYNKLINYNNILIDEALILYKKSLTEELINEKTNIIDLKVKDNSQFYLIIALYFFNFLLCENKNIILKDKKFIKVNFNKNNSFPTLLASINHNGSEINKEMIFNLFLKAFKKNQDEFPRNLFITILQYFSLEELKKIKPTNSKSVEYIDKTIQYQILKIQKISYESMVIKDLDEEEINKNNNNININLNGKAKSGESGTLEKIIEKQRNNKKRKTSVPSNLIFLSDIISDKKKLIDENKKNNVLEINEGEYQFRKTKLNVLGDKNKLNESNDFKSLLNKQQMNLHKSKYSTMKSVYKLKNKHNSSLKIWNNINNLINPTQNQNQINSSKMNLNIDPMDISEKICIKLYSFLCSKKIENFTEKNSDINFLKELLHSDVFYEIKNLILSLKYISLENLSLSKNNYYCFWLNMYNFLTIFSIIYKCEVVSNLYEWLRFLKNSYFTIGNIEISLLEIEAYILRDSNIIKNIYGISINNDQLKLPEIDKFDSVINFGICLSTISSPDIRIYYPSNFVQSLKYNASLFFSKNFNIDLHNGTIEIPEYLNMIEPNFNFKMEKYNDYFEQDFLKMIKENPSFKIIIKKYNWNLNFAYFKNY